MAVHHVDLDDCYQPKTADQDILVSVKIGDGQKGAYSIFLGRDLVTSNEEANLGKAADVGNKDILITVAIRDTLRQTNWTSMTVTVREGGDDSRFGPYKMQAEKHLDTIIYTLKLVRE